MGCGVGAWRGWELMLLGRGEEENRGPMHQAKEQRRCCIYFLFIDLPIPRH